MEDPLSWLYLLIIVVLVVLSGFFSSTETAFACLNQFKVRAEAEKGSKSAKLILKTYERFDKTLIMVLLGYNIDSVIISTISAFLFFAIFKNSGIEDTFVEDYGSSQHKYMRNGQLLIKQNGKTYNAVGTEVK